MDNKLKFFVIAVIVLFIIIIIAYLAYNFLTRPNLDNFVICLKEKGAIFYGAFWCPHCSNQKNLFGRSKSLLPYVECSTPDGNSQINICQDVNITSYPTWEFADKSRIEGEISLQDLAIKSGCNLP